MGTHSSNKIDIALATAAEMPKPDKETRLLVEALQRLGVPADIVAWDSDVNWAEILKSALDR